MNRLLKTLLRTGVYFLDQAEDATLAVRGRVTERLNGFGRDATRMIRGREDHTARYAISFAAGIGLGLGAGLLFAPATGEQTREALTEGLQEFGESVRERFAPEVKKRHRTAAAAK